MSKGFEQLASDKMAIRLGGIYALEGVMNASERPEQYRGPVLEMLCAFVREYTIGKTVFEKPAIDIQAALTVIGRRKGQELPDLAKANIPGANLSGANLSGADLDSAHLNSAYLSGANLSGANLLGANLSGANLTGAKLSRVDLTGANLTGANLGLADLNGAYLSSADLSGANLSGANLRGADLTGANLRSANLRDANLSVAYLIRADLTGAKNLIQTQLNEACGNNETELPEGLGLTLKTVPTDHDSAAGSISPMGAAAMQQRLPHWVKDRPPSHHVASLHSSFRQLRTRGRIALRRRRTGNSSA